MIDHFRGIFIPKLNKEILKYVTCNQFILEIIGPYWLCLEISPDIDYCVLFLHLAYAHTTKIQAFD